MPGVQPPRLCLFGTPTWRSAQGDTPFLAERPYQLLSILACRPGWTTRDELAELMWPERAQSAARGNLRTLLLRTQQLSPEIVLEQQADRLRWQPDSDVARLGRAFDDGKFSEVLALYRGPLMQGMDAGLGPVAAEWLGFERERLASIWRQAAHQELRALAGEPARVASLAESVLTEDPYDEFAVAALARARAAQGQKAEGLKVVQSHAARLAASHGLEPSAALRALEAELRRPALAPPSTPPQTSISRPVAPAAGPALVGRRLELLQIEELMRQPECRLLTLTGLGGVGKSTLARAAMPLLARGFADGAVWIALADLTVANQLPSRIAEKLEVPLQGSGDVWSDVAKRLAGKSMLLVLDNSEHLPDLAPLLATLLERCAGLRLLNTSRARLDLSGEWLLPVEGLPLPDDDESDPTVLRNCDSVRLFESRALAARPSFNFDSQAADVIALVRAVEGLPLAIELAAAWVRMLPVRGILEELQGSLDVFDSGSSTGGKRGLRASFEQSWRLLGEAERGALARLGLLPGAFEREMATQVAQCGLPLLAALVDKSLLQADGQDRYALHPLVCQCAVEKAIAGACDCSAQRARHLAYMTHWLARRRTLGGGSKVDVETERALPHIRSAWQWALDQGEPGLLLAGAYRMAEFYAGHGLIAEGHLVMQRAFSLFVGGDATAARAAGWAAWAQAFLSMRSGDYAAGERFGRVASELAERSGDVELTAASLNATGSALSFIGRTEEAEAVLQRALAAARDIGAGVLVGIILGNLALTLKALKRYDDAAAMMTEALAHARAAQPPNHAGVVLQTNNLGNLARIDGRWDLALPIFEQALEECRSRGVSLYLPLVLLNLARANLFLGRLDEARARARAGLVLASEQGRDMYTLNLHIVLAQAAAGLREADAARAALLDALKIADRLALAAEWVRCVAAYGEVLSSLGDARGAARLWRWSIEQQCLAADDAADIAKRLQVAESDAETTTVAVSVWQWPMPGSETPAAMAAWVAGECARPGAASPLAVKGRA